MTTCPYCSGKQVYVESVWPANDYLEHPENWLGVNFAFAYPSILQLVAACVAWPIFVATDYILRLTEPRGCGILVLSKGRIQQ